MKMIDKYQEAAEYNGCRIQLKCFSANFIEKVVFHSVRWENGGSGREEFIHWLNWPDNIQLNIDIYLCAG